jgi:hypothetical protein
VSILINFHNIEKLLFPGIILLAGLFVTLFCPSCTNLDEELFSEVTPDDYFKTEEQFVTALASAYTLLGPYATGDAYSLQEVSTDEIVVPTRGADWDDGGAWRRLALHAWTFEDSNMNGAWNFGFQGVTTCNQLIYQFEQLVESGDIDVSTAEAFIAELVVLRGFYYWFLLDTFGNIPYVTDFASTNYSPSTVAREVVYANLIMELEAGVPKLSKAVDGTTYGRMNYWAGKHLLAILYLNAGVYTGTPAWQQAADAANEIIRDGGYNLESDYFVNFNVESQGSSEFIFSIPYDQVFFGGFNINMRTLHYGSQNTYNLTAQPWNGYCTLEEFYNSYEDMDLRKGQPGTVDGPSKVRGNFLAGYQYMADGITPVTDANWEQPNPDRDPPLLGDPDGEWVNFGNIGSTQPQVNELGPQSYRQSGVRIGKWEFKLGSTDNMSNDRAIFRYGHVLLIRAEALWRMNQGDAEALSLVNEIRARSQSTELSSLDGVPSFMISEGGSSVPGGELLNELGREMFAESFRRTDLIRWGYFTEVDKWAPPFNNPGDIIKAGEAYAYTTLFPIPRAQLEAGSNLVQNSGY